MEEINSARKSLCSRLVSGELDGRLTGFLRNLSYEQLEQVALLMAHQLKRSAAKAD